MQKLYKRVDGVLRYHEAWVGDGGVIEHWGVAGERGESRTHPLPKKGSQRAAVAAVLKAAAADGYVSADELGGEATLLIEYRVRGMGTSADLKKRHALEARMNETLGWTGLGHCDGGSIGTGAMEVCCLVVDFDLARRAIEADLAGTEFADFTRIYREDD
jgi:hypothetical protein